ASPSPLPRFVRVPAPPPHPAPPPLRRRRRCPGAVPEPGRRPGRPYLPGSIAVPRRLGYPRRRWGRGVSRSRQIGGNWRNRVMDNSIFRFILRYSARQQVAILLLTLASFPFLYMTLELPKWIVNDAISGTDFPKN